MVHPVVASIARELLNKSDNERSGVVSTAMSLLGLYRDPADRRPTRRSSDWRIADLMDAERPVSLYLVVPPSDISRTRPLVRLILNQIARRLTETLPAEPRGVAGRRLLLMLDEFPALGRLDFFESSLAFMAGYGVRAFLVAQSLHQIDRAYGPNHAILDNCHVRVAFAPNDERTAKRLSDALGTATELRRAEEPVGRAASRPGCRTSSMSEQETPRPLLTPGEVLQLPADEALVLVSGAPPIRARKLQYFADRNFLDRRLAAPALAEGRFADAPPARRDDWSGGTRDARCRGSRRPGRTWWRRERTTRPAAHARDRTRAQGRSPTGTATCPCSPSGRRSPRSISRPTTPPLADERQRGAVSRRRARVDGQEALHALSVAAAGAQVRPGGQAAPRRQVGAGRGGAEGQPRAAAACRHRGGPRAPAQRAQQGGRQRSAAMSPSPPRRSRCSCATS